MHHPIQYKAQAYAIQQERLRQAQANRAAREAGSGPPNWLSWPHRLLSAIIRLVPRPRLAGTSEPEPGEGRSVA